jgi:hypothetical protein
MALSATDGNSEGGSPQLETSEAGEEKWQEWFEDPWCQNVIEYEITGAAKTDSTLQTPGRRVTRHLANNLNLVDNGEVQRTQLAYVVPSSVYPTQCPWAFLRGNHIQEMPRQVLLAYKVEIYQHLLSDMP